ncbi:flagellar assembly protein FliW [Anaerobacillus alkalidiazotrophicus]|uniref:Flagellar assembly factor FliW n=1 Tax=Anaerobacillus alkalidiazotrophicus TaxID=472963 RepID=A0A1S2MET1_9BACI|nr:flagellar assembly protein FliW [Anaerobacillus alkalidiazotrophicus]OIJ22367.1 flagellar assembly protein FliW [Anaerobacillus alkalidiazotrophicus]
MKIQTKYLGEVEINEEKIIHFENGIPSFLDEKKFIILPFGEGTPLYILQSVTTPELGFVIVSPFDFFPDYQVKLSDSTIEALGIEAEADVTLFVILTVQDPFTNTTANLQGPVVINSKKQKGKQISLNDPNYTTKHLLIPQAVGQEG